MLNSTFTLEVLVVFIVTVVGSFAGIALMRRWAARRMLDIPNERSSHTNPTPRGGGLVIVLLATIGLVIAWSLNPLWEAYALLAFLVGAWLIAVVSWLDDLRSLSNRVRFAVHSFSAVLVIVGFGFWRVVDLPVLGAVTLGWLGLIVGFLWIVGLTNVYNFMDGIDGIAGGQAVVAGLGWALLGWSDSQPLVAVLGLLLAATSLGFLGHNWPPARIFMGDVGSAFLGFTFAALPLIAAQHNSRFVVAGVLLVWPFVFDASFTLLRRLRHRENVFAAHRSHLYQRLVIAGYSHRAVTLLYMGLAVVGVLLAFSWVVEFPGSDWLVLGVPGLLSLGLWQFVARVETKSLSGHRPTSTVVDTQ